MKRAPEDTRGSAVQLTNGDIVTVTRAPDHVRTRHARRIRLHHVLVRRRRWSKKLDRLLSPADPGRWWS